MDRRLGAFVLAGFSPGNGDEDGLVPVPAPVREE